LVVEEVTVAEESEVTRVEAMKMEKKQIIDQCKECRERGSKR